MFRQGLVESFSAPAQVHSFDGIGPGRYEVNGQKLGDETPVANWAAVV